MRTVPRPRRAVARGVLTGLTPIFRYSTSRDAYVLRGIGRRVGPVLKPKVTDRDMRFTKDAAR